MELLKKQQVDVVLATIDQKDADLEYRPVKMCEFVMAVGKNHHLATLTVAKEGFQYPWVDLKECEKEENVMLLPGSPFRQHADEMISIGDAPIQTEIDLIYMKDIILKTEMEKLYEIICEAIR